MCFDIRHYLPYVYCGNADGLTTHRSHEREALSSIIHLDREVATTTVDEPIHHRDEPQDHKFDGGLRAQAARRRLRRSSRVDDDVRVSPLDADVVGVDRPETKKTERAARRHRHRYVVVVPPTTTG
jgi:hypothetical protein